MGGKDYVETHRVVPVSLGQVGTHSPRNVISVCASHHGELDYGKIASATDLGTAFRIAVEAGTMIVPKSFQAEVWSVLRCRPLPVEVTVRAPRASAGRACRLARIWTAPAGPSGDGGIPVRAPFARGAVASNSYEPALVSHLRPCPWAPAGVWSQYGPKAAQNRV